MSIVYSPEYLIALSSDIGNCRPQFLGITVDQRPVVGPRSPFVLQGSGLQMMTDAGDFDTPAHQIPEINRGTRAGPFYPRLSGLQNLLDGAEKALGIVQHEAVKFLALGFIHIAPLQGLQIQADRRNRSLQLVGDGVDETIMLFVADRISRTKKLVLTIRPAAMAPKKIIPRTTFTSCRQLRMIHPNPTRHHQRGENHPQGKKGVYRLTTCW